MLIDVGIVIIFLLALFSFIKSANSTSGLFAGISLLICAILSKLFAANIKEIFSRNGIVQEDYAVVLIFLLAIILLWGLIYALLPNIKINFDRYKAIVAVIAALVLSFAIGIIACFVSKLALPMLGPGTSYFCETCVLFQDKADQETILSPSELNESVQLPENFRLDKRLSADEQQVLALINKSRAQTGLTSLTLDGKLSEVAALYTNQIINSLRFSHLDTNNHSPSERARQLGATYTYLGENLAIAKDPARAHEALMNSPSHRANILSNRFARVGLAVYSLGSGSIILVEEFTD